VSRPRRDGSDEPRPQLEEDEAKEAPAAEAGSEDATRAGEGQLEEGPSPPPTREELEALRAESAELRDALLRRRADFENYRKRVERDRHAAAQDALAAVFREIVGTVDNLERALAADPGGELLRQGVELTYRELVGLLESHEVLVVDPVGEPFDPERHQALVHEPVPGLAEGTVAEVFRKGYTFGRRLLRPALVKVAKGGETESKDGGHDGVH